MNTTTAPSRSSGFLTWLSGDAGLCGRIALSCALAGGLSMEGLLVIAALLSGTLDAAALPMTATICFVIGAAGGFTHGVLVGIAGRAPDVTLSQALRGLEAGVFWAIPALLLGWLAALWISMTPVAFALGQPGMLLTMVLGWIACLGACAWAVLEAGVGLRHAVARWPERRPGAPLVVATFVVLALLFVWQRPEIWFTDLQVSGIGAVVLAAGATIWIALPIEVFVLHFLHAVGADSPIWDAPEPESAERFR